VTLYAEHAEVRTTYYGFRNNVTSMRINFHYHWNVIFSHCGLFKS